METENLSEIQCSFPIKDHEVNCPVNFFISTRRLIINFAESPAHLLFSQVLVNWVVFGGSFMRFGFGWRCVVFYSCVDLIESCTVLGWFRGYGSRGGGRSLMYFSCEWVRHHFTDTRLTCHISPFLGLVNLLFVIKLT